MSDVQPDLAILCWAGYDTPALIAPFARDHGVTLAAETLISDAAAVARILRSPPGTFDIINLNNPFARDVLYPQGYVRFLDRDRFDPHRERMLPQFESFFDCAYSRDGSELLGICQRFGPFNLVVNTDRVSADLAADQGFSLVLDPGSRNRYGILVYDDFNVIHVCIGAGLNPFERQATSGLDSFHEMAETWFAGAKLATSDHDALNDALVRGDIDFYLSGGVYTAARVRFDGHSNIRAVTPRRGPIDGKGGIAFVEVTSVGSDPATASLAEDFLEYLLRPDVAAAIAFEGALYSPVAQMGDPAVMAALSTAQLASIQWDTLEMEMTRCAAYQTAPSYEALLARLVAAREKFFPADQRVSNSN